MTSDNWNVSVLCAQLITTQSGTFIDMSVKVTELLKFYSYSFDEIKLEPIKLDKTVSSFEELHSAIIAATKVELEKMLNHLKFTNVSVDINEQALGAMVHEIKATEHNVSITSVFARLANDEPPVYAHNPLLKLVDDLYGED